jgi:hypothetical protein
MTALDGGSQALPLQVNAADQCDVCPDEVGLLRPLDVGVDQRLVSVPWQQSGYGHERGCTARLPTSDRA